LGVGVVGREVWRVHLNCNFSPAALRRNTTATATQGGVTKLKPATKSSKTTT
jgi:hypothetical protein